MNRWTEWILLAAAGLLTSAQAEACITADRPVVALSCLLISALCWGRAAIVAFTASNPVDIAPRGMLTSEPRKQGD